MKAIYESTQYDKILSMIEATQCKYPKLAEIRLDAGEWDNLMRELRKREAYKGMLGTSTTRMTIAGISVRVVR